MPTLVRRCSPPALAFLLFVAPLRIEAQTVVIHAGHLVDPAGERILNNQQILVRDGQIVEVGG